MSFVRDALRREAKKLYKEQTKGVPKSQRVPFAKFFKHYKDSKSGKTSEDLDVNIGEASAEDFDFDNLVNINEISDDDVEIVDKTEEENDS